MEWRVGDRNFLTGFFAFQHEKVQVRNMGQ